MKQTKILTHATHVNGWGPAVYMSCMSQNFRLFHVSNLSVRNFRIFLLMYTGSKRLGTSRLHELHESKFSFVSRIEFIRSKLSNFSAHVSGVIDTNDNKSSHYENTINYSMSNT